jgi:hypothetical protein
MPFNKLKKYPDLLDVNSMSVPKRMESLRGVFKRDIEDNSNFKFKSKQIRPIKKDGEIPMETLFHHLTTREEKDEKGKKTGKRFFEMARSIRIHWIKYHIEETKKVQMDIFSYMDRIEGRGDVIRTYIYDIEREYIIILEPYRKETDYFLITAYFLNEPGGKKQIEKKQKKKLSELY